MALYHLNPETGVAGRCSAKIQCRFGESTEHYSTQTEAAQAFEKRMADEAIPVHRAVTQDQYDWMRSEAAVLADLMRDEPDWLPPVDNPAKPDGIPEEEGFIESLEAFKDPGLAMGNCSVVADAVHQFTEGEYRLIERVVGGPYLNVHVANVKKDREGREWVVDYTYSQIEPNAKWPHVAPLEDWEAAVSNAGWRPAEEIRLAYQPVEDEKYKMTHQPTRDGALASDMESHYPDFYAHPAWYRTGDDAADRESTRILQVIRGVPDAEVTIYRALPRAEYGIRPGNWVTLSKSYAQGHASHEDDPAQDWPVIEMRVKASDIKSPGDSINEWGYYPPGSSQD